MSNDMSSKAQQRQRTRRWLLILIGVVLVALALFVVPVLFHWPGWITWAPWAFATGLLRGVWGEITGEQQS